MDNTQIRRSCSLIYSKELVRQLSLIPSIGPRQYYVHSLIHSYGLHSKLKIIRPVKASHEDLLAFHSRDYVDLLRDPHDSDPEAVNEAGLGYDCPVLENMLDWCCSIAGASLTAADHLLHHDDDEGAGVVINWDGGWHLLTETRQQDSVTSMILFLLYTDSRPDTREFSTSILMFIMVMVWKKLSPPQIESQRSRSISLKLVTFPALDPSEILALGEEDTTASMFHWRRESLITCTEIFSQHCSTTS